MAVTEDNRIRVRSAEGEDIDEKVKRQLEEQSAQREKRNLLALGIIALVLVIAAFLLPTGIFYSWNTDMTFTVFLDRVTSNLKGFLSVFVGNGANFQTRFMIVIICAVSGAALGMCGSAYQGAFNNPLAAPKTLGVMGGGALGGLVYVVFLKNLGPQMPNGSGSYTLDQRMAWLSSLSPLEWFWTNYGMCLCSIVGCCLIVAVVMFLTSRLGSGRLSNITVVIFGQVFAAAVTALIAFARYWFTLSGDYDLSDALKQIENYTMVKTFYFYDLLIVVLPIVICMVIVLLMGRRMTLLSFGDDEAASMGINVNRSRIVMVVVCTIMVALSISFCGHVAFLGFISAHLARRIVGPNFKYLLPASMFTGAGLLTLVQYICQSGLPLTSIYASGTVCSILGAVLFIGIVIAQWRKGGNGEWR